MMKKFLWVCVVFFSATVWGQTTMCLGDHISACVGSTVTIDAGCGPNGSNPLNNTVYTLDNPQSFNLGDDDFTGVVNLGFHFKFFGNDYTQIVISDNGYISFNTSNANGYAPWSVETIPTGTNAVKNTVMSCWEDLYQPAGGHIYFQTIGTAPHRVAIVYYDGMSKFSTSCQTPSICYTGAILLFESSNNIETQISNKTVCTSWGGGTAVQGLNNSTGTQAVVVPGRNNTIFSVQNDGRRFTPNGSSYNVAVAPFAIVNTTTNPGIVWEDTQGNSYPYNNGSLTVTVPSLPPNVDSIGYFISSSTCGVGAAGLSDTAWITPLSSSVTAIATDDICSSGSGSVTAQPTSGASPYTFNWPGLGNATTATVNNVFAGTYTVEMTDASGCQSTANVTVGDNPATYSGSSTKVTCPGGSDGTATASMSPAMGTVSYQWDDPNNQTTATATGLPAGTYTCTITSSVGCSGTVQVTVTEIPGMQLQVVDQQDVSCNSRNDGKVTVEVTDGTAPYTYSWTGSSSTSATADDLFEGNTTVTVTDANGCTITHTVYIGQPNAISINNLSKDTVICIGDSVNLFANASGGSSPYTYQWSVNGNTVGTTDDINVTPQNQTNQFMIVVGEDCGSPADTGYVEIDFPKAVNIGIDPDTLGGCFPVTIHFANTTNTQENVDRTLWHFSDGETDTTQGLHPAEHEFGQGFYGVNMEVLTKRGCVYTKDFPKLIEGYEHPEANFYVSPNPATILEPKVTAYGRTEGDIIKYSWFADSTAKPITSSLQNPSITYPDVVGNHNLLLVVENSHHCVDSLTRIVQIKNNVLIFAPNAFTPDGDKFNNQWRAVLQGIDIYKFHLTIYNRWGETVFESFDPEGSWDGTYGGRIVPAGTYVWKINAKDAIDDNKYTFKGTVSVIR